MKFDDEDDIDNYEDESAFTLVLSDTFINFFAILLVFVSLLMLVPHEKKAEQSVSTIGVLCVEISWPSRDIDMDLWGHSPGDLNTVGWTNMHGKNLNLLRDVTGFINNPSKIMMEMECADLLTPGEWTFNVHYFANHENELAGAAQGDPRKAVKVMMVVRIKNPNTKQDKDVFGGSFTFTKEKQEKTMLDFVIDNSGSVIHSSINSRDIPLTEGWHHD